MGKCSYRSKLTGFGGPKTIATTTTAASMTLNATSSTQRLPIYIEKVKSSTSTSFYESSRQKNGLGNNNSCCNNSYTAAATTTTTKNNYRFMIRRKKIES
jgi:hypothetical protein